MIKWIRPLQKTNVFGDTLARGWAESKRTPKTPPVPRKGCWEWRQALHRTLQAYR